MFISRQNVLLTKREASNVISTLIDLLRYCSSPGYVLSLSIILYHFVVSKGTLRSKDFDQIVHICNRTGVDVPAVQKKRGLYYRKLFDPKFSDGERAAARAKWNTHIDRQGVMMIDCDWSTDIDLIMDKMARSGFERHRLDSFAQWLRQNGSRMVPDHKGIEHGDLRVVG